MGKTSRTRRLIVVRHGERVDLVFGRNWLQECIDSTGEYTRGNLNMPDSIPNRSLEDFAGDGPLTQVGCLQAELVGKGLRENAVLQPGFRIYVSPALRCLQTASLVLKGMELDDTKILVEPGLIEWPGWYKNGIFPKWMTVDDINNHGFNADSNYVPYSTPSDINMKESAGDYYERTYSLVKHVLDDAAGQDVVLVGHRATLDTATRQLVGEERRTESEMKRVLDGVPYCATAIVDENKPGIWSLNTELSSNMSIRHFQRTDFCAISKFVLTQ